MNLHANIRSIQDPKNKVLAHASITLALGADGQLVIDGFSVIENKGALWVAPPARKGDSKYFPIVTLAGKIRDDVERTILAEFERQRKTAA
jgi:DNA-binding cell septation regulator SpoVG